MKSLLFFCLLVMTTHASMAPKIGLDKFCVMPFWSVYITNKMHEPFTVHPQSADNDLGNHTLAFNEYTNWSFCLHILLKTRFYAHFYWNSKTAFFDVYNYGLGESYCTNGKELIKEQRVSRGVSNIPGNLQSATSNIPSGKSLMYFGLLLASGVFFVFIAFTVFLPVIVIVPQKFALCFTAGCGFIIGSFFMLKGPKNQFLHMTSTEVLALSYYCICISYFPGGSAGMKFLTSSLTSSVLKCFGS
ncbi:hypothetical protein SSX86_021330 [Deinandra increscens subsp. villosa]|uniref:Vesicle transport protein n=1 Tax=Deinandra increscens subsp. villosa TaxID=3103831 RepID=A0AAP0CWN3_9ASTR